MRQYTVCAPEHTERTCVGLCGLARFFLWARPGHVKLPNGDVVGDIGADSVRQRGRRPTLQIYWLEDDFTVGEIDIDYREGAAHLAPANSDIRAAYGGEPHIQLHNERYQLPPALNPWWRRP